MTSKNVQVTSADSLYKQCQSIHLSKNNRSGLRSYLKNLKNKALFNAENFFDYDIMKLRPQKRVSSFPWENVLTNKLFSAETSSFQGTNETTEYLSVGASTSTMISLDNTGSTENGPSTAPEASSFQPSDSLAVMNDHEIPLPSIYPLFKRRKERYFLSDLNEAKQLIRDFRKAVTDAPVSFCFHAGQIEKYMKFLPIPKDSGYRDFQDMWQRIVYQCSPFNEKYNPSIEDPHMFPINHEVWRKFKINPKHLVNWVANLRVWIARTILHNIVEEIDLLNNKLKTVVPSISIGNIGLDDLINRSRNGMITMNVPSLPILLPYLQITTYQKYLVQRLKELASGNTLSDFSWKSGGKIDDKSWESHLPSDAELIMHLVVTYFDSRMPISLESPDEKPFSSYYFAKYPDKVPSTGVVIYQVNACPPHYQLIIEGVTYSIPSGAYNMFFAILLFLHHFKTSQRGMVGKMFLGQSGINILWTMDNKRA